MLLKNLVIAPALWPIKLGNQRLTIFDADLVDPVLIAVEGEGAAPEIVVDLLQAWVDPRIRLD